jgi:GAF domain-containing protein
MNKEESYQNIIKILEGLVKDESNLIANLSNTAAVLYNNLADINWAGFYLREGDELVLGPFQGKNACIRISKGSGVCGTAFSTQEIQLVDNVHQFDGHIACDSASNSEIVLPIVSKGKVEAVLDIDSPTKGRFDQVDQSYLEEVIKILKKDFS